MSFLYWGSQSWAQYSRWCHTRAEGKNDPLYPLTTLIQPRVWLTFYAKGTNWALTPNFSPTNMANSFSWSCPQSSQLPANTDIGHWPNPGIRPCTWSSFHLSVICKLAQDEDTPTIHVKMMLRRYWTLLVPVWTPEWQHSVFLSIWTVSFWFSNYIC